VIDGPPVLPPSIDEVYEEGIPVCAPLEMPDRYRFHSLRRPRLKLSDANDPRAGGQSKRLSRNLFHSNVPGLPILTDANLAPAEREPSIPSILSKCSTPCSQFVQSNVHLRIVLVMAPITRGAVFFDLIRNERRVSPLTDRLKGRSLSGFATGRAHLDIFSRPDASQTMDQLSASLTCLNKKSSWRFRSRGGNS
jgi:hypothetical protein